MRSWRLLQFNLEKLLAPCSTLAPQVISPDGSNLAGALARMLAADPHILNDVSRDLANLVPGITGVKVVEDETHTQYIVWVRMQDGLWFPPRVLSDGTLRFAGARCAAGRPCPSRRAVFRRTRNGVHPSQFKNANMIRLLREFATDFSDPEQAEAPLRQLLVNTHSPTLAAALQVERELLFAHMPTRVPPPGGGAPTRVTRIMRCRSPISWGRSLEFLKRNGNTRWIKC